MEAAPGFEPGNKGFADLCLTTWLCRRVSSDSGFLTVLNQGATGGFFWSGKRGLNPRPPPWQGGALPLSYSRVIFLFFLAPVPTLALLFLLNPHFIGSGMKVKISSGACMSAGPVQAPVTIPVSFTWRIFR